MSGHPQDLLILHFSVGSAFLLRRPWPSLPALLLTSLCVLVMSKVGDSSDLSSLIFFTQGS